MPAARRARCAVHAASLMAPVLPCVGARAPLDPILALLDADRGSSQRLLGARLRRCARPQGGPLARRRRAMPAMARTRCAMHASSPMAFVLRNSALVLSSTRPSFCSPLTTAQASAASALGCVAAIVRAAALSLAAFSPCRRRVVLAAQCTQRRSWRPRRLASVLVLSSTRSSLCSPLTAAQANASSALGCVAALVRAAALSLIAGSPCRRRLALAARCTGVARCARSAFVCAPALLDPTLSLLATDRGSSQRRLGARLRRYAHPRGGALAHRRLAMPAAARTHSAIHAVSLMAPVLRVLVLVLSSTRPDPCSARR